MIEVNSQRRGPLKILFVCGRNNRRSPTAERIFKTDRRMLVRSAGISETSKRRISENDLRWADLVLVMQRKHAARIRVLFGRLDNLPEMRSLDISDDYTFMCPELIELLKTAVDHELEEHEETGE